VTTATTTAVPDAAREIAPLADRIVVRVPRDAGLARGGLHIPDMARERPQQGDVVAVGPGRVDERGGHRVPMEVTVGDRVLYGPQVGAEVTVAGVPLLILRESDVLAIVG
jgi:chaperonin GroES